MPLTSSVSVVIPTMATAARAVALRRALDSLRSQVGVRARPIVVVNGSRTDAKVIGYLEACSDITLVRRDEGHLPRALAAGRALVDTEYFGVLDDDDEYLPDALATRCKPLDADRRLDAVVTCGFVEDGHGDVVDNPNLETYRADPLGALSKGNWLASCGALYRTSALGANEFAAMPRYMEWTYLAVRLSLEHRIEFLGYPTYRVHRAGPDSISASDSYMLNSAEALAKIMALDLPPDTQRLFARRHRDALHLVSTVHLRRGNFREAWSYHLQSLHGRERYKYLFYTRHIVRKNLEVLLGAHS